MYAETSGMVHVIHTDLTTRQLLYSPSLLAARLDRRVKEAS